MLRLEIKGYIIPKFSQINKNVGNFDIHFDVVSFGDVYYTEEIKDTIEIVNNDSLSFNIFFQKVPKYLDIKAIPNKILPNQKAQIVSTLFCAKKIDYGFFVDTIRVVLLNKKIKSQSILFVTATLLPKLPEIEETHSEFVPQIFFAEKVKYLNISENSKEESCEFIFENQGQSNLIIHDIYVNNGCTIQYYSSVVEPGEKGSIHIFCNDVHKRKNYKKVINVISNDPLNTRQSLRLMYHYNKD